MAAATFTISYQQGGELLSGQILETTHDSTISVDTTLTSSQADKNVEVAFAYSRLKWIYIKSDKDITIETNSGSAADNTIHVKANEPYLWSISVQGDEAPNPFDTDVTDFYLTNGAAATANVNIRIGVDATP